METKTKIPSLPLPVYDMVWPTMALAIPSKLGARMKVPTPVLNMPLEQES